MNPLRFALRSLAVLCALVPPAPAIAVDAASCTALVSRDDDLYGLRGADVPIRYTRDGAPKGTATISPDATFVVHNAPDARSKSAWAAFASGDVVELHVPGADAEYPPLDAMYAEATDAIAVQRLGHNVATFEWLSSRGETLRAQDDLGTACALSRSQVACVEGNRVTFQGAEIFRVDLFEDVPAIDTFTLAAGSSHAIAGLPGASITGRALNADGLFVDFSFDQTGATFTAPFSGGAGTSIWSDDFADDGEAVIWFHADRLGAGQVSITAKLREGDLRQLDPAVAIDARASRVAFVRTTRGTRRLIVLKRTAGATWSVSASVPIATAPYATSLRFVDASTVYVASDRDAGLVDLERETFAPLPATVPFEGADARVIDWACASARPGDRR